MPTTACMAISNSFFIVQTVIAFFDNFHAKVRLSAEMAKQAAGKCGLCALKTQFDGRIFLYLTKKQYLCRRYNKQITTPCPRG
jgi:hypothetical protein